MFLIRPSTRTGNPLTLTLKQDNRPYNINIRQRPDSLFALGAEKPQEKVCIILILQIQVVIFC